MPAGRRETLFLNDLRFEPGNVAALANASFSIRVSSDQPVLAERAVYWSSSGITFIEGHNSPGVTAEATKWAFAEGIEGVVQPGGPAHDSYFLISNANATPLEVRATFVREDGHGVVVTRTIPAQSRGTILTSGVPALSHKRFAAFIESINAPSPLPFVAERATYWGAGYYGGHGATGVPWTAAIATPPAVDLTPQITSISPNHGPVTGGTDITIRGVNFTESTTVSIDSRPAQVFPIDGTTLVATVPAGTAPGSVAVSVTNNGFLPVTDPNGYSYDPVGPLLLADTILAFGDSLTAGITSFCGVAGCGGTTTSYPQRLETWLRARYPAQAVAVQGSGAPGECASADGCNGTAGRDRLPGTIAAVHDLVVILEGVNDTNAIASDSFIVDALRVMVRTARNAGKDVILCGLLPVKPNEDTGQYKADPGRIASMNSRLAALASAEGVPFVDMVAAFGSAFQPLLSPDGLHPNDAGYQRMAEAVGEHGGRISSAFRSPPDYRQLGRGRYNGRPMRAALACLIVVTLAGAAGCSGDNPNQPTPTPAPPTGGGGTPAPPATPDPPAGPSRRPLPAPRIAKTRFVAFGDSLTEGVVSSPLTLTLVDIPRAYPARLAEALRTRYYDQTDIVVLNEGRAGEFAARRQGAASPMRSRRRAAGAAPDGGCQRASTCWAGPACRARSARSRT